MNSSILDKDYQRLMQQISMYNVNEKYMEGENPNIKNKERETGPDNRIAIPMAKISVEDMTGYAGSQISVNYQQISIEEEIKDDPYKAIMRQIEEFNKDDILLSDIYKSMVSQKEVYLLFWTSDKLNLSSGILTPEYAIIESNRMVISYTKSIKPELERATLFTHHENGDIEAEVYYPRYSEVWIKVKGVDSWVKQDVENQYLYESVPVVVFKMSRKGGPIYKSEKTIIDALDRAISKTQNELDRFNALIALMPLKVDKKFIDKLNEIKVIDELADFEKWPEYLMKDLTKVVDFYNNQLDRLERLYHKSVKVVDMTSQDFNTGDESGTARAFKLLGQEFKAADIEKYYKESIKKRTELINNIIDAGTADYKTKDYKTIVTMGRNLPLDKLNRAQIATALSGIVSRKTLFKMLGKDIVEDVEKELIAIAEENESLISNILNEAE
jgi:SPP1 family phage portal protein